MDNLILVIEDKFALKVVHNSITIYKYDEENEKDWKNAGRYYPNNIKGLKNALNEIALQSSYEDMKDIKSLVKSINKNLKELKDSLYVFEGKIMVEGNKENE